MNFSCFLLLYSILFVLFICFISHIYRKSDFPLVFHAFLIFLQVISWVLFHFITSHFNFMWREPAIFFSLIFSNCLYFLNKPYTFKIYSQKWRDVYLFWKCFESSITEMILTLGEVQWSCRIWNQYTKISWVSIC